MAKIKCYISSNDVFQINISFFRTFHFKVFLFFLLILDNSYGYVHKTHHFEVLFLYSHIYLFTQQIHTESLFIITGSMLVLGILWEENRHKEWKTMCRGIFECHHNYKIKLIVTTYCQLLHTDQVLRLRKWCNTLRVTSPLSINYSTI